MKIKGLSLNIKSLTLFTLCLFSLISCGSKHKQKAKLLDNSEPLVKVTFQPKEEWQVPHKDSLRGEMRAVWLTLAYGLDWPRAKADNYKGIRTQKAELDRLLDQLKKDNYNTVFFQVRLSGSVAYFGSQEPFSRVFTSRGTPPKYDPLAYAVEACHKRGLDIHAWLVTYPIALSRKSRHIIKQKNPSWIIRHNRSRCLNPGEAGVRTYIANLATDIAKRYDVDGLHFDYFRYPQRAESFPDDKTYRKYAPKGMSKELWRRDNLSKQLEEINEKVRRYKPNIRISVAPLGKLRKLPNLGRKHGWTALESVHQDVERWAKEGLVDFVVPMMYYKDELYEPFLIDWQKRVGKYVPVVAGLAPYRVKDKGWSPRTMLEQIQIARKHKAGGISFFRAEHIGFRNEEVRQKIKFAFSEPALPMAIYGAKHKPQRPTHLKMKAISNNKLNFSWEYPKQDADIYFRVWATVYERDGTKRSFLVADKLQDTQCKLKLKTASKGPCLELGVEAVSKEWHVSTPCLRSYEFNLDEFREQQAIKHDDRAGH